ncbi:hypothetical protein ACFVWG_35045 [Kribbella sp. NPDC058245]|uniref:hypothetical protein n=1 Tax=Kribbella sp. NPDC058245 TaxID=3346399 RepID=UPI0036E1F016
MLPVAFAVMIVIPAAAVGVPYVVKQVAEDAKKDRRPYSLCPPERGDTEVVRKSRMAEESAPYRGAGPHQVVAVGDVDLTSRLPEAWVPAEGRFDQLQVVACGYQYDVGADGVLATCRYTPLQGGAEYTVSQQSAKYDYRVYEANTGKVLGSFTLEAVSTGCAEFKSVYAGQTGSEVTAEPDGKELQRKLQPFVMAKVAG